MNTAIKLRVSMVPYSLNDKRVFIKITPDLVQSAYENLFNHLQIDIPNVEFEAYACIANTQLLREMIQDRQYIYSVLEKHSFVKFINIEILNYTDDVITSKHLHILNTARYLLKNYNGAVEILRIYNHRAQKLTINASTIELSIGARYRIYLNDIMLIERIYPYELFEDQQLEELIHLDLPAGQHTLKIENVTRNQIYISDLMVNGNPVVTNTHSNSYSFIVN